MKVNVNFTTIIDLKSIYKELDLLADKKEIRKSIKDTVNYIAENSLDNGNNGDIFSDVIIIRHLVDSGLAKLKKDSQYR